MNTRLAATLAFTILLLLAPRFPSVADDDGRDLSIDDITGSSDDEPNLKWWAGGRRAGDAERSSASSSPGKQKTGSDVRKRGMKTRDVREIRKARGSELDDLFHEYDQRARQVAGNPDGTVNRSDPEYQKIEKEYFERKQEIEQRHRDADAGRKGELERVKKQHKGRIRSSGSDPNTVQSDIDVTADSKQAAKKLADEWRAAGDDVTYDPETGVYESPTKDGVIWEPPTDKQRAARRASEGAYDMPGGKHEAGVRGADAVSDTAGAHKDHRKKFTAAAKKGDLRTQGKTLSKAAKATGHTSTVAEQADTLRAGGSTDDAGITSLGESPEVREKKIAEWKENAAAEMDVIEPKAQKQSELKQKVRRKLAEQVRKNTPQHDDWKTADQIEQRADTVDASHGDEAAAARRQKRQGQMQDGPTGKGHVGAGTKPVDKKPGLFSPKSKVGQALDGVGHVDTAVMVVGTGTKLVKGIQKGDGHDIAEVGLGKDTVDRERQSGELEKDADTMDTAVKSEVRSELKAKLMRKGATSKEAEAALDYRDKGDRKNWQRIVGDVKSRNTADTKQRALEGAPELDMKDDWGSRLWEGGKQAVSYADVIYGSPIAKTKESVKQRDALNEERGQTQDGIQEDVDNRVIKKMVREGIPIEDARQAVDERRAGDSTKFNEIRDQLQARGTLNKGAGDGGLDTRGLTGTYETGDYVKGAGENVKDEFRGRADILQEPFNMWAEHGEKKNLDAMRDEELVAGRYKTLRNAGASPEEALEAARSYYEKGDSSGVQAIWKRHKAEKAEAKAKQAEAKKAADDIFSSDPAQDSESVSRLKFRLTRKKREEGLIPEAGDPDDDPLAAAEGGGVIPGEGRSYDDHSPFAEVGRKADSVDEYQKFSSHMVALKGAAQIKHESDDKEMNIRSKGGSEMSKTREIKQDTSAADAFASHLSKGLNEGLQRAGEASGKAAVDAAKKGIADDKDHDRPEQVASAATPQAVAGAQVASTQPGKKKSKKSSKSGKGKTSSKGKTSDGGGASSSGGDKSGADEGPTYETARCGECGYSMKYKTGTRPPSSCPQCSAGKDRAKVECRDCGRSWTIPAGSTPSGCPYCSDE